jgi:8-oxo-dGTP pyrophosphatase MutT (NUDIX family)
MKQVVNRNQLLKELQSYSTDDSDERQFVDRFIELIQHPDAFQRTHLPGHITGSAWICNVEGSEVLLTHHAKLDRWLQPGGHADGDEDVIRVASREAEEETGLTGIALASDGIFDIDIHTIPGRGDMPEHLHYDIRYLFHADKKQPLTVTEESLALSWVKLEDLERITLGNASMMRMARKMQCLF